jgi:tetratricopeptide (TPR) repeat protein
MALWEQNVRYRPKSYMAQNSLGVALAEESRLEEAADRFRESIRQSRADQYMFAEAYVNLAGTLMELGHLEEAEDELAKAMWVADVAEGSTHLAAVSLYNTVAALRMKKADWEGAREYFEKSLELDDQRPSTHSGMGVTLAYLGHFEDAVRHCKRALDLHRVLGGGRLSYEAYDAYGRVLSARGRPGDTEAALRMFEEAVRLQPRSDAALNNLANVLLGLGRREEAIRHYRRALAINRRNADAQHNLGLALKQIGDRKGAEARFRAALEIREDHPLANHSLGLLCLQQAGRAASGQEPDRAHALLDTAQRHLEAAVRLRPAWGDAYNNLGLVHLRRAGLLFATDSDAARQALNRAAQVFKRLIARKPNPELAAKGYANLSVVLLSAGDTDGAVSALAEAWRLAPRDPTTLKDMAVVHANMGQYDKAVELARRALTCLTPAQESLRRRIEADLAGYGANREKK